MRMAPQSTGPGQPARADRRRSRSCCRPNDSGQRRASNADASDRQPAEPRAAPGNLVESFEPFVRILVVEDETKLARFVQKGLIEEGFAVDVAADSEAALDRVRATAYDLIILDIMIPGIDGFGVCRQIRALGLEVPVLMLSARGLVEDRIKGLDTGADDYLTKPFAFGELSARVRALLRRRKPTALLPIIVADLTLDPVTRIVKRAERRLDLTAKEFALLEYLMRNAGQVVTRTMIAEQVWDFSWDRLTNVIDVFINHLRKKIEMADEPRLIHAVRGAGYVIRESQAPD